MTGFVSSLTAGSASSAPNAISQPGTSALSGLNSNFSDFLSLLMTQLRSQDPSAPMDSSQFTSQLVQFSGVEQQINTNSNLTQLIQLTQASQIEQSASMIGKQITVNSTQLSLQNGTAEVKFNTTTAEPVAISVYNASGILVQTATLTSTAGTNIWKWNGENVDGTAMPDAAYKVSITVADVSGTKGQIPFTVTGMATSVQNNGGTVEVQMGELTLPFSSVQSVGN
jgi:flagellar basal-body rod modification protein FlgD